MIHALENHLWQSTLFCCVVAVMAVALRRNRAAVRHALWLSASAKFLIPFSLLVTLGNQIDWRKEPIVPQPRLDAMEQISTPLSLLASPAGSLRQKSSSPVLAILFSVWLCGFAANGFVWWRRWRLVRAVWRTASPLPLNLPVPVLSSDTQMEPGVYGIFRPVLLLPNGLNQHLTPAQFETIIAHELCHIRRFDNLTAALHMLVETFFWFHPMVWMVRTRLIKERELACDEEVLQTVIDPQDYAEGILAVCRFYLKSPLASVSGITGADLKTRVETIMLNRTPDKLDATRKLLLFVMGTLAVTMPLIVGVVHAPTVLAQLDKHTPQRIETSALPEFEVASIRPSGPDSNLKVNFAPGGKLFITNATLRFLIKIAYDIGDDQLAGGPGWLGSKRFDLMAIPDIPVGGDPSNMAPDQLLLFHKPTRLRLQRLLADRFQLELRREPKPTPIFALVVAKGGPKKLAATESSGNPQLNGNAANGVLEASGVDMATLAKFLSEGQTGRPVVDMTGLPGKYNFRLEWSPDSGIPPIAGAANQQPTDTGGGISIFTALRQQLGLKLEARTSATDYLVVLRAEPPSPN